MVRARIVQQLIVTTPNEVGTLDKISTALSEVGLSISHLCASALGEDARFMIVVSDTKKAIKILESMEYDVVEANAIEVEFENTTGTLSPVAKKLADADIDIKYIYGTTADGKKVIGVMSTNDDEKAVSLINT